MATNLVILESPSKALTVKGYLGTNYKVIASIGHVRDLPKSTLGVDIENDFEGDSSITRLVAILFVPFVGSVLYISSCSRCQNQIMPFCKEIRAAFAQAP